MTNFGMIGSADASAVSQENANALLFGIISYVDANVLKIIPHVLWDKFGVLHLVVASHASNKRNATQSWNIGVLKHVHVNAEINLTA